MSIATLCLLLAAGFILAVFASVHSHRRRVATSTTNEAESGPENLLKAFLLLSPFILLTDTEQFWFNWLYFLPLLLLQILTLTLVESKCWLPYAKELLIAVVPGSLMITIILYYLFFHHGSLATDTTAPGVAPAESRPPAIWPYLVYGIAIFILLLTRAVEWWRQHQPGISFYALLLCAVGLPILAIFVPHYFLGLIVSTASVIALTYLTALGMNISGRGGLGFVVLYVHMMASALSIIIYAILF